MENSNDSNYLFKNKKLESVCKWGNVKITWDKNNPLYSSMVIYKEEIPLLKVSTRKTRNIVPLINQKHWLIYKEHGRIRKWNACLYNLTGNKDTLDTIPKSKGINTRDELLKFHSKYYSSNIMSLAVLGKGEWRILLLYRLH